MFARLSPRHGSHQDPNGTPASRLIPLVVGAMLIVGMLAPVAQAAVTQLLSVSTDGPGIVLSSETPGPQGTIIDCRTGTVERDKCSASFPFGAQITLRAFPDQQFTTFTGWNGDCSGPGACHLTMDGDKSAQAAFSVTGTTPPPSFLGTLDTTNSANGPLSSPQGIATNPNSTSSATSIYVVDTNDDRIVRFDRTGGTSEVWASGSGSAGGEFSAPQGIAVDKQGNVYVADTGNDRIEKFDAGGSFLMTWDGSGTQAGMLSSPQGIAVDYYTGDVYVADTGNNRIVKFDSGGSFLTTWDGAASGIGALSSPQGIAVGTDLGAVVYVADTGNDRVVKFDGTGTLLTVIGSPGSGDGEFNAPQGVAIDVANASALYVADTGNDRIEEFASAYEEPTVANQFLTSWGSGDGAFSSPQAVVEGFDVYVADSGNDRVERFGSPTADLSVIEDGTGSGEVSSTPSGIQCGNTCVASFNTDATVTVVATPDTGSIFLGWGGDCSGMDCTVTMDTAKSVTASFGSGFAVSPSSLDFGAVPLGQTKDLLLTMGNGTASPISLSPLVVVDQLPPQPFDAFVLYQGNLPYCGGFTSLQPGEMCGLTVRFWSVSNADDASPATLRVFDGTGNDVLAAVPLIGATTSPRPTDAPNQAPHAVDDTIFALHDLTHSFDVLHNDSDPDADALSILDASQPLHGTVDLPFDRCSGAGVSPRSDCIRYTPYAGYTGPDQFTYTISDGRGLTDTATVRILVQPASPSVADVTPAQGPSTGGRDITVSGDNFFSGGTSFNPVVSLVCGGQSYAAATTFVSEHQLTAITPSVGTFVGPCDVQVSNPGGSGSGTLPNAYTYGSTSVTHALTVSNDPASTGGGSITSSPGSIDCPDTCSDIFDDGAQITLHAVPDAVSSFGGWSDGCAPLENDPSSCTISIASDESVTARFTGAVRTLSLTKDGTGIGSVTSGEDPPLIDCGATCPTVSRGYAHGTQLTLTATAGINSTFDGWGGDCADRVTQLTCTLTMDGPKTVNATFTYITHRLTVTMDGSGQGTVSMLPGGIDCSSSCFHDFGAGSLVHLTPIAEPGSVFTAWGGDCEGVDKDSVCILSMTGPKTVTATFTAYHLLSVTKDGTGLGTVDSSSGFSCGGICSANLTHGTQLTLTATAGINSTFDGWGGDCADRVTQLTCTLTMDGPKTVNATFTYITHRLTVTMDGSGQGTVSMLPGGIDCSSSCFHDFGAGSLVHLTPIAEPGSVFTAWGGDCEGVDKDSVCILSMTGPKTVTATFTAILNMIPTAIFAFNPSSPAQGATVTFDATGSSDDGSIVSYAWDFGDGSSGSGITATHTFSSGGTYAVTLTVTDNLGAMDTATKSIVVVNVAPSAHRVLRGTITRLLSFAPGGSSGTNSVPLAGATVTITNTRPTFSTTTDAQGAYVFTNLPSCPGAGCSLVVRAPGSSTAIVSRTFSLGPDPSTTTLDLQTGTVQDQLFLSGRVLAPGTPPTPTPTISIRVYRSTTLVFDSASMGGPGGFGAYRLALGQVTDWAG